MNVKFLPAMLTICTILISPLLPSTPAHAEKREWRDNDKHSTNRHYRQKEQNTKPVYDDHRKHHSRQHNHDGKRYTFSNSSKSNSLDYRQHSKKQPKPDVVIVNKTHTKHLERHTPTHQHPQRQSKKVAVILHGHTHSTKPKHRIEHRYSHAYYRTPWYNTRYIAPIHVHYHRIGHHVRILPRTYLEIFVSGVPYFYYSGVFYRGAGNGYIVVGAPIGAVVNALPAGFIAFNLGLLTYYHVNNTYYTWDEPRAAYVVVEKPDGAEDAIENATHGRLFAYPNKGQSEDQQAKDRYTCHQWAVKESNIDPSDNEDTQLNEDDNADYKRAMTACLIAHDYTVK